MGAVHSSRWSWAELDPWVWPPDLRGEPRGVEEPGALGVCSGPPHRVPRENLGVEGGVTGLTCFLQLWCPKMCGACFPSEGGFSDLPIGLWEAFHCLEKLRVFRVPSVCIMTNKRCCDLCFSIAGPLIPFQVDAALGVFQEQLSFLLLMVLDSSPAQYSSLLEIVV